MLILDTDALTIVQRGTGPRYDALDKLLRDSDQDVYITIVSVDEQIHGAFKEITSNDANVRVRGYRRLRNLISDFAERPMLDYDDKAESIFDRLKGIRGRPATKDLRIPLIALSQDATLVTGNAKDFEKVPLLKLKPISV